MGEEGKDGEEGEKEEKGVAVRGEGRGEAARPPDRHRDQLVSLSLSSLS